MNRLLFRLLILILIPCFTLYSVDVPNEVTTQQLITTDPLPDLKVDMPFTYDDIVGLLEQIEDGSIDERYTSEQVAGIAKFLIQLARIGALPDEDLDELEADIQELLSSLEKEPAFTFAPSVATGFMLASAHYGDYEHVVLCKKGFFHRCTDHVKHFCRKHKKPILIGVAVAVVVVVVVAVVVAAPAAGAAAAAAAAAAADSGSSSHKNDPIPQPAVNESSTVQARVSEQISSSKEVIAETSILKSTRDPSFVDTAREVGSSLAHQVLDGVGLMASIIPESMEDAKKTGSKCWSASPQASNSNPLINGTPTENFEKMLAQGHQAIDQIFDTDQASRYTQEAKESRAQLREELGMNETIGIIFPPGALGKTPTQPTNVKGWKLGEDIKNLTRAGNVPSWDAVRSRYWKDRAEWAEVNPHNYGTENIPRMEKGLAPQRFNKQTGKWESMELHHTPPQREGGLFDVVEVWPDEHALLDPDRYLGG